MKDISREQILIVKRAAMDAFFWDACGYDDDNGFDRLMRMDQLVDLSRHNEFEFIKNVYLHKHICWDSLTIGQLKDWVFGKAVQLLCGLCDVPLQEGMNLLFHTRTSEPVAENGSCTRLRHSHMTFAFPKG